MNGPIRGILSGERIALNFLQRLSGIATKTSRLVSLIKHTKAKLLDTRKTVPTLRGLEKSAVKAGGGQNHRFGLFDMILIKDTHVRAAGGVGPAIIRAKEFARSKKDIKIEVEVQSYEQFLEAVKNKPDIIMLDNMDTDTMSICVKHIRDNSLTVKLEASGNISEDTIIPIAETGVDFISAGCITHSASALDIHLVLM